MQSDKILSRLLSNVLLDISKAFFIAALVSPSLGSNSSWTELLFLLTKGMVNGIFARRLVSGAERYLI